MGGLPSYPLQVRDLMNTPYIRQKSIPKTVMEAIFSSRDFCNEVLFAASHQDEIAMNEDCEGTCVSKVSLRYPV